MPRPLFSILMAVHRPARGMLGPNLAQLARQKAPPFEVLLSPDDDSDYLSCIPSGMDSSAMTVRIVERSRRGTGPGLARNDAAEQARGDFYLMLDADDQLAGNYLETFAKHFAKKSNGAALAPTRVVPNRDGRGQFDRGAGCERMDLDGFMLMFAPVHVVCHRELHIPWRAGFAEDALRDALLIRRQGSLRVLGDTRYLYQLHEQQTSLTADNAEFLRSYESIIAEMRGAYPDVARLFENWRAVSGAYGLFARPGEHWCEFAERLRMARSQVEEDPFAFQMREAVGGGMP